MLCVFLQDGVKGGTGNASTPQFGASSGGSVFTVPGATPGGFGATPPTFGASSAGADEVTAHPPFKLLPALGFGCKRTTEVPMLAHPN